MKAIKKINVSFSDDDNVYCGINDDLDDVLENILNLLAILRNYMNNRTEE